MTFSDEQHFALMTTLLLKWPHAGPRIYRPLRPLVLIHNSMVNIKLRHVRVSTLVKFDMFSDIRVLSIIFSFCD